MRRTLSLFAILALFSTIAFAAAVDTTVPDKPTFNRDVLPIMQENCQGCHRPVSVSAATAVPSLAPTAPSREAPSASRIDRTRR